MIKVIPKYSIILCTYNGAKKIGKCLQSLADQDFPKNQYEIIVVNDGSTDNTLEILSNYEVKIIDNKINKGISISRNIGLNNACGDIIVCVDDDCTVNNNFLTELDKKYQDKKVMGVAGNLTIPNNSTLIDRYFASVWYGVASPRQKVKKTLFDRLMWYYSNSPWQTEKPGYIDGAEIIDVPAACSSYRTILIKQIGGWDDQLVNSSEDNDLSNRLLSTFPDKKIVLAKKAIVVHHQELSFVNTLRRENQRIKWRKSFYKKNKMFPVIFPQPILLLFLFFVVKLPLSIFLLPFVVYPWWVFRYFTENNPHFLVFPYIQFIQETNSNIAIIKSYLYE